MRWKEFCNILYNKTCPVTHCLSSCLPPYYSLKRRAKKQTTQTMGHVILALAWSQVWLREQSTAEHSRAATVTCRAWTRKVAKRHISPPLLLLKNSSKHDKASSSFCLTLLAWIWDVKVNSRRFFSGWVLCVSASLWPVCPPAGCGRPGWAGRTEVVPSTPACVTLREWVGRPTAGAAEHMQREGGKEQEARKRERERDRERGRREGEERDSPFLPPRSSSLSPLPSGPLHCHPPLSKPPLADPPGCKFLVCGPNTKIPNPSKSQAAEQQLTDSHTCPPIFLQNAPSYWSHNTPGFI